MTDRTLVLLRHAKAAHPEGVADEQRPLTPRGHADASAAGAWIAAQRLYPDVVVCSPARRTRETWHGVALALGAEATAVTVVYDPAVYESGHLTGLLDLIVPTGQEVSTLLMIGHNPTISMLSAQLDPTAGDEGLRTSGIAVHRVPGTWADLAAGGGPLVTTYTARAS
jgi:phosphohistidine phosphatase